MGCFSFRSLLLAAIVISNCITWTASRHSYPHNVSGRRHRRQDAGEYQLNSYVIPGGEGSEKGWSSWSDTTPCSRTCGGGVASQMRICLTLESGANCTGGDKKYFSCNTQDCPGASDFRAEQCAEFNEIALHSVHYSWIPYMNGPRNCELYCKPKGERFYYRQAAKVKDGTRCNDESFDVCVDGTCQKVGCDMMLGSDAREDKCRVCRGNGTNCYTNSGTIDNQDYTQGYTDILLIPVGAMNIVIEEIDKSNNNLALRSKNDGKYYLNGYYQISFPHTLHIAGTLWHYERREQSFAARDKLRSLGPTNETLYLSLLTQEPNVGIRYEYSIPGDKSTPPTNQNYTWSHEEFSPCSVSCGTGFRFRNVTCRTSDELEIVDDSLCESGFKPIANETCQLAECMPEWVPSPWGPCSKLCGTGGSQSRSVQCQIILNGYPSIVDENRCLRRLGDKPEERQKCNVNASCPTWFIGQWKPCENGKRTRQVVCHRKTNGRVEVLEDVSCEDEKPETEQPCNIHPCDGIDWVVSNWIGCDSCVSKFYTREALCVTKDRQVVQPELCSYHRKPDLLKPCNEMALPLCGPQWYAAQWSDCSVDCGVGVKTRKVICGDYDGWSVQPLDESICDADAKYNDTAPCEVPAENCPARWYVSRAPWSECTRRCDGGEQYRKVMCLRGGKVSTSCPEAEMPDQIQSCNTEPCNFDELLSGSSPDDEDWPDCEEENEEIGAKSLSSTSLIDTMSSDASSTSAQVTTKPRCRPRNKPYKCTLSEFGCCPDQKTPASGPLLEGCPSPTKSGCCPDGVSPTGGPHNRDCPVPNCEETLYGCCKSDHKTTAEGNDQEGCPPACKFSNTTEFGCCDDGQTAAHGPNKLGCCLLTPHGCCPDNFQPAQGANLEGCDCKNSPFGCCPDQKSYATGANHTGCGCQHTAHGCCPDRHTEATGPNFEGCSCHTHQFGCCPDGVTAAIGFNLQGCRCEESKHGCCGDGVTPATGPNKEGCDCASSKYGCCPDGVTESQSKNFTGCAEALINKQDVCREPLNPGPCRVSAQKFYWNLREGRCEPYTYGGCEGSANRFSNQAECEEVCGHLTIDICQLPQEVGPCRAMQPRWYYDQDHQQCRRFDYGGCLGNKNNFETEEECRIGCVRTRVPPTPAPPQAACALPYDQGNCTNYSIKWFYDMDFGGCSRFLYGGCGGNGNRFADRAECESVCIKPAPRDACHLPKVTGICNNSTVRWYYDNNHQSCQQFDWGGCLGNNNNHKTQEECEKQCSP